MDHDSLTPPLLLKPRPPPPPPPPGLTSSPSTSLEIRLFYVRISPCVVDSVPDHLSLRLLRRELGFSVEINGSRVSDSAASILRRDRIDRDSSEVTYVSTDSVRVSGGVEFEVYEERKGKEFDDVMLLCGSVERMEEGNWSNGMVWSMDCFGSLSDGGGGSAFVQPKMGVSSPVIEVYVAGCCNGVPVILTKMINVSPRRKSAMKFSVLDVIPEDEEVEKEGRVGNGFLSEKKLMQFSESEEDEYEPSEKFGNSLYSQAMYNGEDGQLTWFNAGVRVGVGIGLGMCIGLGVGVGLLMHSYQATTRTFKRRFF